MNASPLFILPLENIVDDGEKPRNALIRPVRNLQTRRRSTLLLLLSRAVVSDISKAGWPKLGLSQAQLEQTIFYNLPPGAQELYRLLACSTGGDTAPPMVIQIVERIREQGWDDLPTKAFRGLPVQQRLAVLNSNGFNLTGDDFLGIENGLRLLSMLQRAFFRERASERLEAAFAVLGLYAAQQASFHWQRNNTVLAKQVRRQLSPRTQLWFDHWDSFSSDAPFPRLFLFLRDKSWHTWARYPGFLTCGQRAEIAARAGFQDLTQNGAAALVDASVHYLQGLSRR